MAYRVLYSLPMSNIFSNSNSLKTTDDKVDLEYIKGFLNNEECDHIVSTFQNKTERSKLIVNGNNDVINDARTSSTYYIAEKDDPIIKSVEAKIITYLNSHVEEKNWLPMLEMLQIVKYEEGQEFKEHHDWFQNDYLEKLNGNQRHYTFFVYLNSVELGGETVFPNIDKTFVPTKGDALFWENCREPYVCNKNTLHQGKPPQKGTKYGLNAWVRFYPI